MDILFMEPVRAGTIHQLFLCHSAISTGGSPGQCHDNSSVVLNLLNAATL